MRVDTAIQSRGRSTRGRTLSTRRRRIGIRPVTGDKIAHNPAGRRACAASHMYTQWTCPPDVFKSGGHLNTSATHLYAGVRESAQSALHLAEQVPETRDLLETAIRRASQGCLPPIWPPYSTGNHHLTSVFIGGPSRNRTCDTRFRKPLLYPLSYGAIPNAAKRRPRRRLGQPFVRNLPLATASLRGSGRAIRLDGEGRDRPR